MSQRSQGSSWASNGSGRSHRAGGRGRGPHMLQAWEAGYGDQIWFACTRRLSASLGRTPRRVRDFVCMRFPIWRGGWFSLVTVNIGSGSLNRTSASSSSCLYW